MKLRLLAVLISALLVSITGLQAQDAVNLAACVAEGEYSPEVDYFPQETTVEYAENFTVEYFNHYKVVTVTDAFDGAEPFTYVLVQCGTPTPDAAEFAEGTQFINVPVQRFVSFSTTQIPHLDTLGALDTLVGMDSFLYVNNAEVVEMIEAGELVELGFGSDVNLEAALEIEPDLAMGYGFFPESDAWPILLDAGIPTVLNAEWREASLLGRAEWVKFTALFYNAEETAEEAFATVAQTYNDLTALTAEIPEETRPVVLWNTMFGDTWAIPGATSYGGELTRNAGGVVALGEEAPEAVSALLSFETVYEGGAEAPVWILNAFMVPSLEALEAQDARYVDFAAFQSGNVWNNDLIMNANGGTDYYERGASNPHLILADMIAILHPDLLPDHEFNFFRKLN